MESWLSRSLSHNFLFHDGILDITKPFHELFFFTMEFWLSGSLFTNFSFSRWNSGYQEAFSRTFLFHDGILAIKERFTQYNSQNARIGGRLFAYISQRVFTHDPPR
jgi:hypothetical protein